MSERPCSILWTWDDRISQLAEHEIQVVSSKLQCSIVTSSFNQALRTLTYSSPHLFTYIILSVPQVCAGYAQLELLPPLRLTSATPILVVPTKPLPSIQLPVINQGSGFQSLDDVSFVRNNEELLNHLALIIPRIISENDVIWPQQGDIISSNQSKMHYTIGQRIAEGSYAVVHQCTDFFKQVFVMKIQKPHRCKMVVETDWNKEKDFLVIVNHPNVIRLYDAFMYNNLYYYVMEKADGTLRSLIEEQSRTGVPLPYDSFMDFAGQLLSGLCHIHKQKIIHRDLQVDNILYKYESGKIVLKISDFGISKNADVNNEAMGTTGRGWEVAPELIMNGKTTYQSDIYQLGLIFYNMRTGWPAVLPGEMEGNVLHVVQHEIPFHKAQSLRTPLGNCISKMLHADLAERFRNPYEVQQALLQATHYRRRILTTPPRP